MTDTNDSHDWGNEMDRPEHEKTYEVFLNYTKWGHHYCYHYLGDAFALCV